MKKLSLSLSLLLCVLVCSFSITSCSDTDEPESTEKPNPLEAKILGSWSGDYSYPLEDMTFSVKCELSFGGDGSLEVGQIHGASGGGSKITFSINYEINADILSCDSGYGEYKIMLSDDTLILKKINHKDQDYTIWSGISATINGVHYYESPNELVFKRIK